MNDEKSYYLNI